MAAAQAVKYAALNGDGRAAFHALASEVDDFGRVRGCTGACSKADGLFAPPLMGLLLAHYPGIRVIAPCAAAPMAVATVAIGLKGREAAG